jgi:hypothetical protein
MRAGRAFDHRVHTREVGQCQSCHDVDGQKHGALRLSKTACNECHHSAATRKVRTCEVCHEVQDQVYQGKLAIAQGEQSVMASAVTCAECHADGEQIVRNVSAACVGCHDAAYADTLAAWQADGKQFEDELILALKQVRPDEPVFRHYTKLAEAYRLDGSASVHNPNLFKMWLSRLNTTP